MASRLHRYPATNTVALSASHRFKSPLLDSDNVNGRLDGGYHRFTHRVDAPEGVDASLLFTDDPFTINGSTSGFNRLLFDGAADLSAMAGGYGLNTRCRDDRTAHMFADLAL
jgi:hypothetical protein